VGCVVTSQTTSNTNEDTAISLLINPLFFIYGEVNATENSMNEYLWTTTWLSNDSHCVITFDAPSDTITMTPSLDWSGTCAIQIYSSSVFVVGYKTYLNSEWVITVDEVNDPVVRIEDTIDTVLSGLANVLQGATVSVDGCKLFSDPDKEDFTIDISGDFGTSSAITLLTDPCNCYTGNKRCPVGFTAVSGGAGDFIITATDPSGETATATVGVTVTTVNQAPVASAGVLTLSANEGDETVTFSLGGEFSDPDNQPNPLEFSITSLSPLALEAFFEGSDLTIKPDPTQNGTLSANVTVTDSELTAVKTISFVLNPVNDPVVIADSLQGKEFSNAAGQNTSYDLSSEVTDEDNVFIDGSLTCTPGSVADSVAVVTITKNMLLIQHRLETSGTTVTITCQDNRSPQSQVSFDISIVVTFTNSPPTSSALPLITSTPPAAGQITLNPVTLSTYFTDVDLSIGQTLTYSAVASNSSAVDFNPSSLSSGILSVIMKAGAIGTYNITVTGTDSFASTSQVQSVLAYVAPKCSTITANWDPVNSLVVDVASYCVASNSISIAFTETEQTGTLFSEVSFTVSGSRITLSSSDACASGKYLGIVTVTDSLGASVNFSVEITVKPSSPTVSALKSSFSYLVVNGTNTNSTGYDGTATVKGARVKINLIQLAKLCGAAGGLKFFKNGTDVVTFLSGQTNNDGLETTVDGVDLFIGGTTRYPSIVRSWSVQTVIKVEDNKSGSAATFTLMVMKPYLG